MRTRPRACVIMRCSSEAVKNLWEAISVACTACIYTGTVFFHVFLKFKRGMAAVCSMTTPMRVYRPTLRIYSAVILVLAIGSLKMKQTFDFFFVLQYKSSGCVLN